MLAQFCERFPKYALFAPHWTPKAKKGAPWKPLDLTNIDVLYLFDRAANYPFVKGWLHENAERRLVLLEPDPGVVAALLQQKSALFEDPQVDLEFAPFDTAELAERYPAKRIELLGPQKLRLELLRKTTLSHALFTDRLHGYQPFENFVRNLPHLKGAFYANALKGAFQGIPAIVCGAGPSLQTAIPLLKKLDRKALIIAGGSAVAALSARGVLPHFGMAIDPNLEEYRRFRNSLALECPLLFSTRLFPGVFQTCNGPFGYIRSGIGGAPELWLEEELGLMEPLLGENLSDESTSVMPICLAFAQHIGCPTILLAGVDLAYTGGKRYADGISEEKEPFKEIEAARSAADRILRRKDKRGKLVHTAVRWVMEAAALGHFAKKHPEIRWINATEGGLRIDGFE
ncbi:MAG TPA: 6-hydroxymethylpterin diphosphokinase MptE-like protein, partial [Chlamydiales bacterium]|nr:6-hydroxymethylpterin diphosphokinase MptE-like protein [Chlamydiales bacterium]